MRIWREITGFNSKIDPTFFSENPGYEPNIRPSEGMERGVTSSSYFFFVHGAEAMTYEVGDNTPRNRIRQKGEATARELMRMLNRR
ncbi:M14 family metallopeptidase [Algoriphagus hitonicola]|uniref:hypothetical protein n=1 Tax=Algoriphagus hitonicola TaxID=435880 RepID=UPI00360A2A7C